MMNENLNEVMEISATEKEELIENIEELLDEYDYEYSNYGLTEIVNEWNHNKGNLIKLFKKHPNYVEGKYMIAFSTDFERAQDMDAINAFRWWVCDYALHMTETLPEDINNQRKEEGCSFLPDAIYKTLVHHLLKNENRNIDEELAKKINESMPWAHAHAGQKATRVVNKICTYLNYNKHPDYNREFAKYADGMNPLIIKRHTILSINPLDYLTMSFGNSWASCHTIDKTNKRNMPNSYQGMYSSGTISYMLDGSSIVMYTVDGDYNGDEFYNQPKINRCMFHYSFPYLVQGRMYPQDNDGCSEIYTEFRNIIQKVMSDVGNFPNLWKNEKGTEAASKAIISEGTHYRDYYHFNNCNLSTLKGEEDKPIIQFVVGHDPICIDCGEIHTKTNNINCCQVDYECDDCGRELSEENAIEVSGNYYCRECVRYCYHCEEYHRDEEHWIEGIGEYVCDYCARESGEYFFCEDCERWFSVNDGQYIDDEYICESCYENRYTTCDECGCIVARSEVTYIDGNDYCEDCVGRLFVTCDECGDYIRREEIHVHENGKEYCDGCYKQLNAENEEETM